MDCEIEPNYQQLNCAARACSDNLNPHAQREITNFTWWLCRRSLVQTILCAVFIAVSISAPFEYAIAVW